MLPVKTGWSRVRTRRVTGVRGASLFLEGRSRGIASYEEIDHLPTVSHPNKQIHPPAHGLYISTLGNFNK